MLRLCANLGFLWSDRPLLERIDAAARAGFSAVEFHWPYEVDAVALKQRCDTHRLKILGLNTPRGDVSKGEFGTAALIGREAEFREQFNMSAAYALVCGAGAIHVMAGVGATSREVFVGNLRYAASQVDASITLLLEPLNSVDNPGYFYSTVQAAVSILNELALSNVKLQFDAYHVARTEGDMIAMLRRYMPYVAHLQIAGVPSRHEPDQSEFDYRELMVELERLRYGGFVAGEYKPRGATDAGLSWMKQLSDVQA